MTRDEVMQAVADSDLPLDAVSYLAPILQSILEPTAEQEAEIKTVIAQLTAGLEGMRNELGMPWKYVPRKRITELATQLAELASEWSVYDSFLVGTFLAASARAQLMQDQPEEAVTREEQLTTVAGIAASANQQLSAENRQLKEEIEQADEIAKMARRVVAGLVTPNLLLQEALKYAAKREL